MEIRSFFRIVGSLKCAVVVLVLLCIAMACATVHEAMHGSPAALAVFYKSRWFEGLLELLAVNVLASLLVRFPWSRRQIGFVITHVSILTILGGAWVSKHWAIDGQISIVEGQSASQFTINKDALTVRATTDKLTRDVELTGTGGLKAASLADSPAMTFGEVRVKLEQYVPDSRLVERIVNDNPQPNCAIEAQLGGGDRMSSKWIFVGQQPDPAGLPIVLREVRDKAEVDRFLAGPTSQPAAAKTVKVEVNGTNFEFPLDQCLAGAVKIGETGLSLHVLRYLPHAQVGEGMKLTNASDRPVNPAIEYEIVSAAGTFRQVSFARFPDFGAMHNKQDSAPSAKVVLNVSSDEPAGGGTAIEIVAGPDGRLAARFKADPSPAVTKELKVGTPIDTPWASMRLTVLRRFDRARRESVVETVEPPGEDRTPAVLATFQIGDEKKQAWLRKYASSRIALGSGQYEASYKDKVLPLGFEVRLGKFQVGRYPGSGQPRTFESHVTLVDSTGAEQSRVISMNNPAKCGSYTLFQSSYQQNPSGAATSVLSVSCDPGQPIVFTGYISVVLGMLYVLVVRMRGREESLPPRPPRAQRTE